MLEFIAAVWNEEEEINDLLEHVCDYVDRINVVDDVSTDRTPLILDEWWHKSNRASHDWDIFTWHQMEEHTGLCEVVRIKALEMCDDDSWVLMLDADERFAPGVLERVVEFCKAPPEGVTHVYFSQHEYIDGVKVAEFAKVKLFKKSAGAFSEIIHRDPSFVGEATNFGGVVIHRKSSQKQVMRELQYLDTYDKLLDAGKVTQGDVDWFKGMHHFVRDRHG
jgi:glycosyltransferase involved in cell wall biosynthesis